MVYSVRTMTLKEESQQDGNRQADKLYQCRGCEKEYTIEEHKELEWVEDEWPDGDVIEVKQCENGCEELIVLLGEDGSILSGPGNNIHVPSKEGGS